MMEPQGPQRRSGSYWLDRPENVAKVCYAVWVVCGLLLVAEAVIDKHPELPIEGLFGFHGFFGFVSAVGLVLAAKGLRRILARREDYYDR